MRKIVRDMSWSLFYLALAAAIADIGAMVARGEPVAVSKSQVSGAKPRAADAILLDFYADWCGPCQSMTPTVNSLAQAGYVVQRINIDQQPDLARQYGVNAIPCFVVVQQGREIDRVVGVTSVEHLTMKLKGEGGRGKGDFPSPAWRYERPVGHRAAVVRIYCQDDVRTRSIGSGVLVRWSGRSVVLTARHVVKGAKKIIVELCTQRRHGARVVKVDAVWDCAVLELVGKPEGVEPAEVELGDAAMQQEGNRLESCGYGPDGRLACNSGLFLGYRRSTETPQGPDDWLAISGRARGGDSGGPVFNRRGRVVGVLWGTDSEEVVCVQAGRIHKLLDAAVPEPRAIVAEQRAILQRNPTPAKPDYLPQPPMASVPRQPADSAAAGGGCCPPGQPCDETAATGRLPTQPLLPWRGDAERRDDDLDARIRGLLAAQELERQERLAREAAGPSVVVEPPPKVEAVANDEPSPLIAGLCILGAVVAGFVIYFATQK